jgi:hypothetical protein
MGLSFILGNDEGFVESLAQLDPADSKFDRIGFQKKVREEMDSIQLDRIKPSVSLNMKESSALARAQKRLSRFQEKDENNMIQMFSSKEEHYWKTLTAEDKEMLTNKFKEIKEHDTLSITPLKFKILESDMSFITKQIILSKIESSKSNVF